MPIPAVIPYHGKLKSKVRFPRTSIDMDDRAVGNMATVDPLEYAPITRKLDIIDQTIYLSDIYHYKHYPIIFAYIKKDNELIPQVLYFSKSHAVWRVAPAIYNRFAKGYNNVSCDLPPLLNLALLDDYRHVIANPQQWKKPKNLEEFVNALTFPVSYYIDAPDEYINIVKETSEQLFAIQADYFIFDRMLPYTAEALTISPVNVDDLPDLSSTEFLDMQNAFYKYLLKDDKLRLKTCLSFNSKVRYLFGEGTSKHDQRKIRFLLTVAPEPVQLNEYMLSHEITNIGYRHITPLLRSGDSFFKYIAKNNNNVGCKFFIHINNDNTGERYATTTNYCLLLPINDLLNHPEKIKALRDEKNKETAPPAEKPIVRVEAVDYHKLLEAIKIYIENTNWQIKDLFNYHNKTVACDGINSLPSYIRKQHQLIECYFNKIIKGNSAIDVFNQVKEIGLDAYNNAESNENKFAKLQNTSSIAATAKNYYAQFKQEDRFISRYFQYFAPSEPMLNLK